jgi:beta-lactam-binding protein with PASTA domain
VSVSFFDDLPIQLGDIWPVWEPGGAPVHGRPSKGTVPDVRGFTFRDALTALGAEGFRADVIRLEPRPAPVMGTVVEQDPPPGQRLRRGKRIRLTLHHPRDPNAPAEA